MTVLSVFFSFLSQDVRHTENFLSLGLIIPFGGLLLLLSSSCSLDADFSLFGLDSSLHYGASSLENIEENQMTLKENWGKSDC